MDIYELIKNFKTDKKSTYLSENYETGFDEDGDFTIKEKGNLFYECNFSFDEILEFAKEDFKLVAPPIDWSKVGVDTKVLVRDGSTETWIKAYFKCKYAYESIYPFMVFSDGKTKWASDDCSDRFKYCKLAEEG